LRTTFGAFLRRLLECRRMVTLPLPERVVLLEEPASRAVPVSFAEELVGGIALIVQVIVLPSEERSQTTRTLGVSPLSPLSPLSPRGPGGRAGPAGPGGGARPAAPGPPGGPRPPRRPRGPGRARGTRRACRAGERRRRDDQALGRRVRAAGRVGRRVPAGD